MKKLTQTMKFNLGFWGGMLPFLIINYVSYINAVKYTHAPISFSGCDYDTGFPIAMFGGCYGQPDSLTIEWVFLIADLLIAVGFSVLCGRIIKNVWSNSVS
jgi:uncharacterized membrane protein